MALPVRHLQLHHLALVCLVALWAAPKALLAADADTAASENGPKLGVAQTQRYRAGVTVEAKSGPCKGILCTLAVPTDWPEQQVVIDEEDFSSDVARVSFRKVGGTVLQMVVEVPRLEAGQEAHAIVTYEVTRHHLVAPDDTLQYNVPEKTGKDLRVYLGPSPGIETKHAKVRSLAKEVMAEKEQAWQKVEAAYDWVRDNIKYVNGPFKGAVDALKSKEGDCEELSSLFIAMCRSQGIPARTVWIPGHCYPEFYLEDRDGQGHWFPCQAAGTRAFGAMPEFRPILQKGDNFTAPERPKDRLRYVNEYLTGAGGKPEVKFIRELIGPDGQPIKQTDNGLPQ